MHIEHLHKVFHRLGSHDIKIKSSKCVLGVPSLDFLGHNISEKGITPSSSKVEVITKFPSPSSVKQLQRLVGMKKYYHRFIPQVSDKLRPLYQLIAEHSGKKSKQNFEWTKECEQAVLQVKHDLSNATMLAHPQSNANYSLTTDASNYAVGAVLQR